MTVEADGSVRHDRVVDLHRQQAFALFIDLDRCAALTGPTGGTR